MCIDFYFTSSNVYLFNNLWYFDWPWLCIKKTFLAILNQPAATLPIGSETGAPLNDEISVKRLEWRSNCYNFIDLVQQQWHGIESAMQVGMRQPTSAIQTWLIFALAPPSWIFLTHCFAKNSFVWHIWQMQWNHHDHHHHLPLYITKIKNTAGC